MAEAQRFKIFIAAYLVLEDNGKLLLHKRANSGYEDGNYSLVAGHLDGAETAKHSIIREAYEEAGIKLTTEDLEVVHVTHRFSPTREYIDIFLKANKWQGQVVNKEPHKCAELAWFPKDNLPDNLILPVKHALEQIDQAKTYSDFGWQNS